MNKLDLPSEFISNIQNVYGENGHAFLESLPDLIAEATARWGLTDVQPAPTLSYNFAAWAGSASAFLNGVWRMRYYPRGGALKIIRAGNTRSNEQSYSPI